MRVLVVHNYYTRRHPSGENDAVDTDVEILRDAGVEVRLVALEADALLTGRASQRWGTWRAGTRSGLLRQLAWGPDVVHVHNPFPLLAGSALETVRASGVPLVATVHNYRFTCMAGLHYRAGALCHDCDTAGSDLPGVRHGCYRGSALQSAAVALRRPRVLQPLRACDHFFVLTDHHRHYVVDRLGVDPGAITVRATPITPDPSPVPTVAAGRHGVLFVGRLSEEKGIGLLLEAWRRMGEEAPVLTVIGDGPRRDDVRAAATASGRIRWQGRRPPAEVASAMAAARLLVIPSTCYEGLPRVAVEAFAAGLPVVGTVLGGLRSVLGPQTGAAVDPDADAIAAQVRRLDGLPDEAWTALSTAARLRFEADFGTATARRLLLDGYDRARRSRQQSEGGAARQAGGA